MKSTLLNLFVRVSASLFVGLVVTAGAQEGIGEKKQSVSISATGALQG
jgi:hypothetical protein